MKNSLDIPEKENQHGISPEVNERLLTKLYESDERNNASSNDPNETNGDVKWEIKEKLFLVSFVLINGDSDWTYVSEQLNKWIDSISTGTFKNNAIKRTFSVNCFCNFFKRVFFS